MNEEKQKYCSIKAVNTDETKFISTEFFFDKL